jgi:hypothetical protein
MRNIGSQTLVAESDGARQQRRHRLGVMPAARDTLELSNVAPFRFLSPAAAILSAYLEQGIGNLPQ